MHIEILGNGREIGRSAFLVSDRETKVMLDFGVKLEPEPPQYPLKTGEVSAVILSHAHLDHSGAVPMLYSQGKPQAFMTDITLDLSKMLLLDSIKVARKNDYSTPFLKSDIKSMIKNTHFMNYKKKFNVGEFSCSLLDSGHIPGAASVILKNRKTLFYTADIQTEDTNLLHRCKLPEGCDVLITESTYSYKNHPNREKEERSLRQHVEEALSLDEKVLLPVFATGRAQEVLLILERYANKIALDGMAKKASDIISQYTVYLKDKARLKNILRKVHWIHGHESRLKASKKFPIIIATAGMLGGGPAIHYLREMRHRPESKVLFTGFLVEESPGGQLIETKIFKTAEEQFKVHCELHQFHLSAHTDRKGLFSIMRKLSPKSILCVHGERTKEFAHSIEKEFPEVSAYAPKNGDEINV